MKTHTQLDKKWSLIGIPDHEGIDRVGGRLGANFGPQAFRHVFKRLAGQVQVHETCSDFGNIEISRNIEQNHRQASDAICDQHRKYSLSVIVGGGHDHAFSHLRGLSEAIRLGKNPQRLACINIDAHLDVRKPDPEITSGSPFYLALEEKVLQASLLTEFGIQTHCNKTELWNYVQSKKIKVISWERLRFSKIVNAFEKELKRLATRSDAIAISLDLDAAAQVFAPGVSAPQAEGFSASDIIGMMEIAGRHPKVVSLGIFELNPLHDIDDRTARLAATAAHHFVTCFLNRKR